MDINAAFPGKYFKAADLSEDVTVTINDCKIENVGQGAQAESKPVLRFAGRDQGLVLNVTNSTVIKDEYGSDTDKWIGKPVTLYRTTTEFGGQIKPCIRVRVPDPVIEADVPE